MDFMNRLNTGLSGFLNDPEQMARMMAAASMMTNSGPSNRPIGLGEIMGGGLSAYLGTKGAMTQQQAEAAEREQQKQYRGVQMQGEQLKQDQVRQALAKAQALQVHLAKRGQGAPAAPQPDAQMGEMLTPMQQMPQMPQPQENPYQRHMSMADYLRSGGFEAEANEYEDRALKFAPKVKNWQQVRVGDSVQFAPFFEDGSTGKPVPLEIARQMEVRDGGGTNDVIDPMTGKLVTQHRKTQSPDNFANNFTAMRGQNMTDDRARDFNAIQQDANNIQRGEKQRTDNMTRASQVASFDTMLGTLDRLGTHKGLDRSVGVMSALPTIPGSESANFQAELETFQSQAFIPMVAQLKGMGALSDAEGRKLTAAVGALNPSMSRDAFKASIARIKADMEQARQRVTGSMTAPSAGNVRRYNPATGRIE